MGRHKEHKTQVEEATQRQNWQNDRNERRRDDYQHDPAYRHTVNTQNRSRYRKEHDVHPRADESNLARIAEFGKVRTIVLPEGIEVTMLTFTIRELGQLLGGYHQVGLYRWNATGQLPKPMLPLTNFRPGANGSCVYSEGQARRILRVMIDHQKEKLYYHRADTETIEKMEQAMKGDHK